MEGGILFVQGGGADVHDAWDAPLARSLERATGATVSYPRMPREEDPRYDAWAGVLRDEIAALGAGAILVGHSVGGTVLARLLAAEPPASPLGALVLIAAPFPGPGGWQDPEGPPAPDGPWPLPDGMPVLLYHGAADEDVPPDHARLWSRAIPGARLRLLPGRDHQLGGDLGDVAADLAALGRREGGPARRG